MNEQVKVEVINTVLLILGVLSVFFAGYVLETLIYLSLFLFVAGVISLSVKAVPFNKGGKEE